MGLQVVVFCGQHCRVVVLSAIQCHLQCAYVLHCCEICCVAAVLCPQVTLACHLPMPPQEHHHKHNHTNDQNTNKDESNNHSCSNITITQLPTRS